MELGNTNTGRRLTSDIIFIYTIFAEIDAKILNDVVGESKIITAAVNTVKCYLMDIESTIHRYLVVRCETTNRILHTI